MTHLLNDFFNRDLPKLKKPEHCNQGMLYQRTTGWTACIGIFLLPFQVRSMVGCDKIDFIVQQPGKESLPVL